MAENDAHEKADAKSATVKRDEKQNASDGRAVAFGTMNY
jgi:hypothetical protein